MIYLDNNATARPFPEAMDAMMPFLAEHYGNPSSAHSLSAEPRRAISWARGSVARLLGAGPDEIVFTSGGTESDNWAILGALKRRGAGNHVITTTVEHEAVRVLCERLEGEGVEVSRLEVDRNGVLDKEQLLSSLREDTAVVSVMLANNETGVLFPVDELAEEVKARSGALFHVDAVNAAGKVAIDLSKSRIDLLSISAHKFHGPKGIGALFIRKGCDLPSVGAGGGQEGGRRPGTEAVHQIAGMGTAAEIVSDLAAMEEIRALRDELESGIENGIEGASVNGGAAPRVPNTSNVSFRGVNGEALVAKLNERGIFASTGSACNEGAGRISPVLEAMGIPFSEANGSVRFSLGRENTGAEIEEVLSSLPGIVDELREISGYAAAADR